MMRKTREDARANLPQCTERRASLKFTACVAMAMGLLLAATTWAGAVPITYTFAPGTSIAFADGNTESVSGTFILDNVTGIVIHTPPTIVTLAGSGIEADFYQPQSLLDLFNGTFGVSLLGINNIAELTFFFSPLVPAATLTTFRPSGADDWFAPINGESHRVTAVTGSATLDVVVTPPPDVAAPEPSAALCLASAFGLLLLAIGARPARAALPTTASSG